MGAVPDPMKMLGLAELADDYRAPPPRWAEPWTPRVVTTMTVVGALLVGFLIASGVSVGRSAAEAQDARKADLIALIEVRQEHVDTLSTQLDDLRGRVAAVEEQVAGASGLRRELDRLEERAGLTALGGPGLRVVLDDASGACPSGRQRDCEIQDVDLQLALNRLFGLGAEAVAVNGERVIATTAIRNAGRAILVNYRVLAPPYEVVAIGDPEALVAGFAGSDVALDFAVWSDVYGLRFDVEPVDEARVPAFGGSLRLRYAGVAEGTAR